MGHRSLGACGLGLGGGIALLLLARRKGAAGAFGLAFVALVVTLVHEYGVAGALPAMGQKAMALSDILLVVSAAQWEYARRLARAGALAGRCWPGGAGRAALAGVLAGRRWPGGAGRAVLRRQQRHLSRNPAPRRGLPLRQRG